MSRLSPHGACIDSPQTALTRARGAPTRARLAPPQATCSPEAVHVARPCSLAATWNTLACGLDACPWQGLYRSLFTPIVFLVLLVERPVLLVMSTIERYYTKNTIVSVQMLNT